MQKMRNPYDVNERLTCYQIFPTQDTFVNEWKASPLSKWTENGATKYALTDENIIVLYHLLYSRYANSAICGDNVVRVKYDIYSIILNYGPTWQKELEIQRKLLGLSLEELQQGSIAISNHASNPETAPKVDSDGLLTYIDAQSAQIYKKSPIDAYANLLALLNDDVTEKFIKRFKVLFTKFPTKACVYSSPDYMEIWGE